MCYLFFTAVDEVYGLKRPVEVDEQVKHTFSSFLGDRVEFKFSINLGLLLYLFINIRSPYTCSATFDIDFLCLESFDFPLILYSFRILLLIFSWNSSICDFFCLCNLEFLSNSSVTDGDFGLVTVREINLFLKNVLVDSPLCNSLFLFTLFSPFETRDVHAFVSKNVDVVFFLEFDFFDSNQELIMSDPGE